MRSDPWDDNWMVPRTETTVTVGAGTNVTITISQTPPAEPPDPVGAEPLPTGPKPTLPSREAISG